MNEPANTKPLYVIVADSQHETTN